MYFASAASCLTNCKWNALGDQIVCQDIEKKNIHILIIQ